MWCRSAVNRNFLSLLAASRTRSSALGASVRHGVGTRFAAAGSLWPDPFPPSPPPPVAQRCSATSQVVPGGPTSRVRSSSAYVLRLPDASRNCWLRVDTGSPGSHARCFRTYSGSVTARDPRAPRDIGALGVAFRFSLQRRRPEVRVLRG